MIGITHLLLLLWAGATVSTLDLRKRIFGGQECGPRERHYHVKLIATNRTHESLCGGSLIWDQWVLTAAHCWKNRTWTVTANFAVHPRIIKPLKMIITEAPWIYNDSGNHDIMLLHLPRSVGINPVSLPNCRNRLNISATVQVAGHGRRDNVPHENRDLNCLDLRIVNCQEMMNILQQPENQEMYNHYRYQHWFCYQRAGVDTCPGDSGGGVLYNNMIYGVHAFSGTNTCSTAAAFMDVCAYEEWINNTIHRDV